MEASGSTTAAPASVLAPAPSAKTAALDEFAGMVLRPARGKGGTGDRDLFGGGSFGGKGHGGGDLFGGGGGFGARGGKGGGFGGREVLDPGPLPKYGELAGLNYVVVEAGSREVVGICKAKLKV